MLNFGVNYGHVAALAVVNFFLSWIWYSPLLFARPWMIALGKDPDRGMQDMTEAEKKMMPFLFANGFISSFLLAFALAVVVASVGAKDFGGGACAGLVAWIGFSLTGSLGTLWEGRHPKVLLINNGLFALTYIAFGGILAAWN